MQEAAGLTQAQVPRPRLRDRKVDLAALVAALCVVITAMRFSIHLSITAGTLVGVALAPVWFSNLGRFRGARALILLVGAAALAGLWLTDLASADHQTSSTLSLTVTVNLLNFALLIGLVLWARTLLSRPVVGMLAGAGMLLGISTDGRFAENPWRFGFAGPVTVLLLAAAWYSGRRSLEVLAAVVLAAACALSGARSMFAMLLLAAIMVTWVAIPRPHTRAGSRFRIVLFAALLGFGIYQVGQGLILDGYLGEQTQLRTEQQVEQSGSLILGARPEAAATAALMVRRPWGYGAGTQADGSDVVAAKSGMAELNYDPQNGYVEDYMFGRGIELHSTVGDMWAAFGPVGVLLAGTVVVFVVRGLTGELAHRTASALMVYLAVRSLWETFFGPFYSAMILLGVTVALLIPLSTALPGRPAPAQGARASRTGPRPQPRATVQAGVPGGAVETADGRRLYSE
ncbi:MAG TPA: hypothetical protein VGK35_12710 [Actinotalea sp.]